jgi:hypothetical protein
MKISSVIVSAIVLLTAFSTQAANLGFRCSNSRFEGSLEINSAGLYELTVVMKKEKRFRSVNNLTCVFSKVDPYVFSCMRQDLGSWTLSGNQVGHRHFREGFEVFEDHIYLESINANLTYDNPDYVVEGVFNRSECHPNNCNVTINTSGQGGVL